jgi:predicted PurR-regulated permease PerM
VRPNRHDLHYRLLSDRVEVCAAFGILAGIFEFVPLLGPAAIGLFVTSVALLSDNPWKGLYVFIFLVTLRVSHDYITYPRIVQGGINLHPVLIILSVLAASRSRAFQAFFSLSR